MKKNIIFMFLVILAVPFILSGEDYVLIIDKFVPLKYKNIKIDDKGLSLINKTQKGEFLSLPIETEIKFNVGTINFVGKHKKGIVLKVRFGNKKEWSNWIKINKQEKDFKFPNNIFSFIQYKVEIKCKKSILKKICMEYDYNTFLYCRNIANAENLKMNYIPKPYIVSRAGWGARPPKGEYTKHYPNKITIHHTYRPKASDYKGAVTIRQIQNYHMDHNGWMDIGYHFLIGTYPSTGKTTIYQGRPEYVIGAHTGGHNTNNIGVNVIGDYMVERLHPNSYKALVNLIAWLCYKYKISPDNIYGHRDFGNTSCPGDILYAKIPQIKRDVRKKLYGK